MVKRKQKSKIDKAIIGLVLLLSVCVTVMCGKLVGLCVTTDDPVYATISDNMLLAEGQSAATAGTVSRQAQIISLYNRNPDENLPFQMTNMFPGDSVTRYYRVSVSYTGTIMVSFQATAGEFGKKLGEVLKAKVRLMNTEQVLYEGTIAGMPQLEHVLTAGAETKTEELYYEITIGLGTDVGNEYQNCSLMADLSWWTKGDEDKPTEPNEPTNPSEETTEPTEPSDSEGGALANKPLTGDDSRIMMWLVCMIVSLAMVILVLVRYRRIQKSRRKLQVGIFLVVLLIVALGITSLALIYEKVTVEENLFETGRVSICLNDNQPVFAENILLEPGMVVENEFTLRNDSSCDVYYRLYFSDIVGMFAEQLMVDVIDDNNVIFRGTLADMNGRKSEGAAGLLWKGEKRRMTIKLHVPEDCGNDMQDQTVLFDLNADAVQAVNNPSGLFE